VDAGRFEASERMPEKHGAEPKAAMRGRDAHVLNRADFLFGDPLDRAARLRAAGLGVVFLGFANSALPLNDILTIQ
jgi:hypothetical protein